MTRASTRRHGATSRDGYAIHGDHGRSSRPRSPHVSHASYVLLKGVAVVAMAFGVGIAVYVLGSFALTGAHTGRRSFVVSFRELLREALLAAVTQPFLPLFYFVGRRMDALLSPRRPTRPDPRATAAVVPVVFVHGYMQNRVGFIGLARALAKRGFGPLFGFNYDWLGALDASAERLGRFIDAVCAETGAEQVDLVCHSMGGLVALEMMRRRSNAAIPGTLRVRRCVTIASPHAGVMWRGPIFGAGGRSLRRGSSFFEAHASVSVCVPCLSVYSTHDNVVHPKETSSLAKRGGQDVEVEGLAHLAILFSPAVAEHVARFLAASDPPSTSAVVAETVARTADDAAR